MRAHATSCTLHPFGDEWLWDENGRNGLTVPLDEGAKVAEAHRAECMKGDESPREVFAGMWFSLFEATSENLVALGSPSGKLLEGDEAMAWYGCIGTDRRWPKPTSILIEWDGGFTTASSEEEAEAIIARKLEEWEAVGDAGDRGDFLVSPNLPEA